VTERAAELSRSLQRARAEGLAMIEGARDLGALEEARVRTLGRKAPVARARGSLGRLTEAERRAVGQVANDVHEELESALTRRRVELNERERASRWERERIDVTLPGDAPVAGSIHPLTQTVWEIVDIFIGFGYGVAEGPDVELTRYLFDALNMPAHHPARSPLDTYFVKGGGGDVVLRTETSAVQIRTMEARQPPIYVLIPGRVYRREEIDPTHLSQFSQIEGLAVDEGITMADLKGSLDVFARELFGKNLATRLRPHFFPFTEPSAELDVECFVCRGTGCRLCKRSGWIEVLGCGMVDPFLFQWVGYDPERYTGFAWGMGIERIAALAHGVGDIRHFYENDVRFLDAFRGIP
jgi:phenylalanyl-tRNA synthetase alpha chain